MAKRKQWQDLTITDDYMFKLVMNYPHICKHLIEKVLRIKIERIEYIENEKSYKNSYGSKGIRLDVYVQDEAHSRFMVEMQVRDYGHREISRRSRFYQSTIDFDFLAAGSAYKDLGNAAIIFFCPFDLFDGERRMYTFRNLCVENPAISLDDGMTKVFLSSTGQPTDDLDPDVAAFLDYMNGKLADNSFVQEIDNEIRSLKTDGEKEAGYMTFQMRIDEEREEVREKTALNMLRRLVKRQQPLDTLALTDIAEDAEITLERVQELARENGLALH